MTTTFRDYVCWRNESVLAMTPVDAASLTDGHFQAIHYPLRLRRRRLDQRSGGTWATEEDVLNAMRGTLRPDGYLFIPVVGGSGTGKSHLVRWVKDQTQGEPGWEVRYLPEEPNRPPPSHRNSHPRSQWAEDRRGPGSAPAGTRAYGV